MQAMAPSAAPALAAVKPTQRKLMIGSRDLHHRNEVEKTPDIHRQINSKRQGETSTPLQSYHHSPDASQMLQKQNW